MVVVPRLELDAGERRYGVVGVDRWTCVGVARYEESRETLTERRATTLKAKNVGSELPRAGHWSDEEACGGGVGGGDEPGEDEGQVGGVDERGWLTRVGERRDDGGAGQDVTTDEIEERQPHCGGLPESHVGAEEGLVIQGARVVGDIWRDLGDRLAGERLPCDRERREGDEERDVGLKSGETDEPGMNLGERGVGVGERIKDGVGTGELRDESGRIVEVDIIAEGGRDGFGAREDGVGVGTRREDVDMGDGAAPGKRQNYFGQLNGLDGDESEVGHSRSAHKGLRKNN